MQHENKHRSSETKDVSSNHAMLVSRGENGLNSACTIFQVTCKMYLCTQNECLFFPRILCEMLLVPILLTYVAQIRNFQNGFSKHDKILWLCQFFFLLKLRKWFWILESWIILDLRAMASYACKRNYTGRIKHYLAFNTRLTLLDTVAFVRSLSCGSVGRFVQIM